MYFGVLSVVPSLESQLHAKKLGIHPQRDVFASRQRSMRVLSVGIDALLGTTMRCDNYVAGGGLHFL